MTSTTALASKPHAFGGAVLSPDHARNLNPDLVLQLTSALSHHASHAAASRGILPPSSERLNVFQGSELLDQMISLGSINGAAATTMTPVPNKQQQNLPLHILQLLRSGSGGAVALTTSGFLPQTPKASSSPSTPASPTGEHPHNQHHLHQQQQVTANSLSILSTAEALESFASWRTHYTTWITEAWNVLKWSEPSAALFWEMATMFHTLYVKSLSESGGGSGGIVRECILGGSSADVSDTSTGPFGAVSRSTIMTHQALTSSVNAGLDSIPPIYSCNSQSSMGSVRSAAVETIGGPSPCSSSRGGGGGSSSGGGGGGPIKPARSWARELPVWLISMFLLVHCENYAFLRCMSCDDERRVAEHTVASSATLSSSTYGGLHAMSPASHLNNANCAAYLLRHLRKFLLLCAVPRHTLACRALATLSAKGGGMGGNKLNSRSSSVDVNSLDIETLAQEHDREHGTIGLSVEVTIEELDRLHLVLQAPGGGFVDEPPIAIGEHVLKCLVLEEMEMHRKSNSTLATPATARWNLMQNGLIAVADAERVLRGYLEQESTMAKVELDRAATTSSSEDVRSRLSTLSLGVNSTQPAPPLRSRGVSVSNEDGISHLKELSYQRLRSTTVLLEPRKDSSAGGGSGLPRTYGSGISLDQHSQASVNDSAAAAVSSQLSFSRLHDLHIADCTDTQFYLLQPFEHATIAACADCTIVIGAVAGLLHVVGCERTTITSAARRVVVSNSCDVVNYIFTPSPPLLVGDNRGCQFAPYNTYYEGLREDLLATGLAALLLSASSSGSVGGSVAGDSAVSPGRGGETGGRCIQCANNKWKVPVELSKLEVPQLPHVQIPGSSALESSGNSLSPRADDRATVDVTMKTPILMPSSEFEILLVPVESDEARIRRQQLQEAPSDSNNEEEEKTLAIYDAGGESTTLVSTSIENEYCRSIADMLTLSPFHMPHDYERKAIVKAERVRALQSAMQELSAEQRAALEEEINRGFQDWLVTSGNYRQVLDLIRFERDAIEMHVLLSQKISTSSLP